MSGTVLQCEHAGFAYDGREVVKDITFCLQRGQYLCIVGQNGSGKSTLVKGIVGLKTPCAGHILLCGGLTRDKIGYLPQQTQVQRDFPASVREVVLSGTRAIVYTRTQRQLAQSKMRLLEIEELARCSYRNLSGGQQQRVLLARALCAAERMLVLDEPAAGLDPLVTQQMYKIIAQENRTRGMSVVMVSHDVRAAVQYADHILHLHHTPVFFGTTQAYCQSACGKAFLGGDAQ